MIVCLYFEDTKVASYEADGATVAGSCVTFRIGLERNGLGKGYQSRGGCRSIIHATTTTIR